MNEMSPTTPTLAELLDYPVHPFAAYFPMLSDDDLDALAADIKANGLQEPIVVRREPRQLIDGRNRRAACHRIGFEPTVEIRDLTDEQIGALVISRNVNRRHQRKEQLAMATAMILPLPVPGKHRSPSLSEEEQIGTVQLSYARTVRRLAPHLVPIVIAGDLALKDAYDKAKAVEDEAKAREDEAVIYQKRIDAIRKERPDLADLIVAGKLSPEGAEADIKEGKRKVAERQRRTTEDLASAMRFLAPRSRTPQEWAGHLLPDINPKFFNATDLVGLTPANVRDCGAALTALAEMMEESNGKATQARH